MTSAVAATAPAAFDDLLDALLHDAPSEARLARSLVTHAEQVAVGDAGGALQQALMDALAVLDDARAHGHPAVLSAALTDVARALASLRAYDAAEACLMRALAWTRWLPQSADLQADLLCALAEVACNQADLTLQLDEEGPCTGSAAHQRALHARQRARAWAEAAAALCPDCSDTHWEVLVLMRAADVLERGGDTDDAVSMHRQALALTEPAPRESRCSQPPGMHLSAPRQLM